MRKIIGITAGTPLNPKKAGGSSDSGQNANRFAFLEGKKYYAFGDSIVDMQGTLTAPETFGDTGYTSDLQSRNIKDITVEGYVTAIERRYGLVATNYGKGGQTLVGGYPTLATLDYSDVALVTIAYGVNDARTGVTLGTVNSNDITTFAGAMNNLLRKIYTDNPECRVVILTPIQRLYVSDFGIGTQNANGHYLIDFCRMCEKVAAKRSTACINMYEVCGINQTNLYYYTVEGVHPVNQGFARMTNTIIPVLDGMFSVPYEPFGTMTNTGDTEPDEPDNPGTGGEGGEQPPVEEPTGTEVDMTGMFLYEGYSMDGWNFGKDNTKYQHAHWVPLPSKTYAIKSYVPLGTTDTRWVSWSIYNEDGTVKTGNYGAGKIGAVATDINDTEIIGTNEYTVLKITLTTNSTWEDGIVLNIPCLDECVPYVKCSYI